MEGKMGQGAGINGQDPVKTIRMYNPNSSFNTTKDIAVPCKQHGSG
jgi:hypothetical protein